MSTEATDEPSGIIGEILEEGLPVIFAFVPELPSASRSREVPHLTVVSWKYDGARHNGMPDPGTNQRMRQLEELHSDAFEDKQLSVHAYHRTGNGLKEFAYYIADPGAFITEVDRILRPLPRFPIDIKFYLDEEWTDFQYIVGMFKGAPSAA